MQSAKTLHTQFKTKISISLLVAFFYFIHNSGAQNNTGQDPIDVSLSPVCLSNSTSEFNGQYSQRIGIKAQSQERWHVVSSFNAYKMNSQNPPGLPIALDNGMDGDSLAEQVLNNGISEYNLDIKFIQGKERYLMIQNTKGEYFEFCYPPIHYPIIKINGPYKMCLGDTATYEVDSIGLPYGVKIIGGMILQSNSDSSKILVQWNTLNSSKSIQFMPKQATCSFIPILNIVAGQNSGIMACKKDVNIDLGAQCKLEIQPSLISAYPLTYDSHYAVEIQDPLSGEICNYISKDMVGKIVKVKLVESCGFNYCWSQLHIEDKTPPKLWCPDTLKINCHQPLNFKKSFIFEDCSYTDVYKLDSIYETLQCDSFYAGKFTIMLEARDQQNSISSKCKTTIFKRRINLENIVFPKDLTHENGLNCGEYGLDDTHNPHPTITGFPRYLGVDLEVGNNISCGIIVNYEDRTLAHFGCVKKIERTWIIAEWWCEQSLFITKKQIIHISDKTPPTLNCAQPIVLETHINSCNEKVLVPPLENVSDDCSKNVSFKTEANGAVINSNGGLLTLTIGNNLITYYAYDPCGNFSACTTNVYVKEKTAPTMVCKNSVVASVSDTANTRIFAISFDNGSFDNCALDSLRIRKIKKEASADSISFNSFITFGCEDVADSIVVELKGWDNSGNSNSCYSRLIIQDKKVPIISCPQNITVSCSYHLDSAFFHNLPVPEVSDDCEYTINEDRVFHLNECRIGYIERKFNAFDKLNSSTCTSVISVINDQPKARILWPKDYYAVGSCSNSSFQPDSLPIGFQRPIFEDGVCELLAASHEDRIFKLEDQGSCFKIIRKWTVIDYCLSHLPNYTPEIYEQIIKISNETAPNIEILAADEACTDENNCEKGYIDIIANGSDDCTQGEELFWEYTIHLNYASGHTVPFKKTGKGGQIIASDSFPIGQHLVFFTFEDRCGNIKSTQHYFQINSCKTPTPVCLSNASIALVDMVVDNQPAKMACVKAESLNNSSYHACGLPLTFSFSEDITDTIKCFSCEDIGSNTLKLYVTDSNNKQFFCQTTVEIQNINGFNATIDGPSRICKGMPATLIIHTEAEAIYQWSNGNTTKSITVSPNESTTYSVTITMTDGCRMVLSKTIEVESDIALILGNTNICPGQETLLSVNQAGSYLWSNGNTTPSIQVAPSTSTVYRVTVTSLSGCKSSGSTTIAVNPIPDFTINSMSPVCSGTSSVISASGFPANSAIMWSTGESATFIAIRPTSNTTYSVTVTSQQGCSNTKSVNISVNPSPVAAITGDLNICDGENTTLTATGGPVYFWNIANIQNPAITVNPNSNSVYTVTVTNEFGCRDVESVQVIVNPNPNVSITGNFEICLGDSTILIASGGSVGSTYLWSPGNNTTQNIKVSPLATTNYSVTVTTTNGCTGSATRTVVVKNCTNKHTIISGQLMDYQHQKRVGFPLKLTSTIAENTTTNENGLYTFQTNKVHTYATLSVPDAYQHLQGVSTLDVICLQNHILKRNPITNPHLLIASDINGDQKISVQDLLLLKKNILGLESNFNQNSSWKLLSFDYVFSDPTNSFKEQIPAEYRIETMELDTNINLVAIKIGDVNGDFQNVNGSMGSELPIKMNINSLSNNYYEASIGLENSILLSGGQIQLEFECKEIKKITSNLLTQDEFDFNINENLVKISLHPINKLQKNSTDLLRITFETHHNNSPISIKIIDSPSFSTEFYDTQNKLIKPKIYELPESLNFAKVDWIPNPWQESSKLNLHTTSYDHIKLCIYNLNGQKVMCQEYEVLPGNNTISVTKEQINNPGVYLYKITGQTIALDGKFIVTH